MSTLVQAVFPMYSYENYSNCTHELGGPAWPQDTIEPGPGPWLPWASEHLRVVAGTAILGLLLLVCFHVQEPGLYPGIPTFGIDDKGWFRISKARRNYVTQASKLVAAAVGKATTPFQMVTDGGVKIFLPARYAEEFSNVKQLSFAKGARHDSYFQYPGLQALSMLDHQDAIIQKVCRQNLTQSLSFVLNDLAEEASLFLEESLGASHEWNSVRAKTFSLDCIARISSRMFVGEDLCRNQEWLHLAKNYTVHAMQAIRAMRGSPPVLRPIVALIHPAFKQVRQDSADAKRVLEPVIEKSLERNRVADANGLPRPRTGDTFQWLYDAFRKHGAEPRLVDTQLCLSAVAIHTSSELLSAFLFDVAQNEEFVQSLREEMVDVLREDGAFEVDGGLWSWKKTTLYKMKLLDSALKESQRIHVRDVAGLRRVAEAPVTLSDGTRIPKGAFAWVTLDAFRDPNLYPEPDEYRPQRFLDLRKQPGQENRWQLVSTSADFLAFGLGKHACPGRFFASNELKLIIVHLLLKYDLKLVDANKPGDVFRVGGEKTIDEQAKIMFRRRREEVELPRIDFT